jgi:hypothetical protein
MRLVTTSECYDEWYKTRMTLRYHLIGQTLSCPPREEENATITYPQIGHWRFRGRSEQDYVITFRLSSFFGDVYYFLDLIMHLNTCRP